MAVMLPTLVEIGSFRIYSYGVFFFLGFIVGLFWWWRMGRDEHLEDRDIFDVAFLMLFAYFVVGRIGYASRYWKEAVTFSSALGLLVYPGLLHWAGVIAAGVVYYFFALSRGWQKMRILDALVVALSLLMSIVQVGSFLNGSNPGLPVSWGVEYPGSFERVVPVDVLGIAGFFLLFLVVTRVRKNFRFYAWYKSEKNAARDGLASLVFVGFIGIYYFVRSFVDDNLAMIWGQPVMRVVGVGVVLASIVLIYVFSGRKLSGLRLVFGRARRGVVQLRDSSRRSR